jgi:hypothetical protein
MPGSNHLTDRDIILLVDGELPPAEQRDARKHLQSCWSCRSRLAEIEGTIADFVHAYHGSLDAQLPPAAGPRALLRAQLEKRNTSGAAFWWARSAGTEVFTGQHASIAASLMVACLAVFAIYERGVSARPGDLSTPRTSLTPGETRDVTLGDVCRATPGESAGTVPVSLRQQVFREYGIDDARPNAYEVDYLITPELGGSGSIRNLWPQPYSAVWNAHVKDALEDRLHGLVCAGQVDLGTAQREISRDWIGAYKKYFHTDKPI